MLDTCHADNTVHIITLCVQSHLLLISVSNCTINPICFVPIYVLQNKHKYTIMLNYHMPCMKTQCIHIFNPYQSRIQYNITQLIELILTFPYLYPITHLYIYSVHTITFNIFILSKLSPCTLKPTSYIN